MHKMPNQVTNPRLTRADFYDLFREAISRKESGEPGSNVARAIFDRTHPQNLLFCMTAMESRLRDEIGALEAPGESEGEDIAETERILWDRFNQMRLTLTKETGRHSP